MELYLFCHVVYLCLLQIQVTFYTLQLNAYPCDKEKQNNIIKSAVIWESGKLYQTTYRIIKLIQ